MKKRETPEFIFSNSKNFLLYAGGFIIFIFFIIYFIVALKTGKIDYFSFFFNNIIYHLFYAILAGFHVSVLGFGILIVLIAFFQTSLKIRSFDDRFEINLFLQKKKIVYFRDIKKIEVKIFLYEDKNPFKNKSNLKEARVLFANPVYNFFLTYKVKGYFDNLYDNFGEEKSEFFSRNCEAKREEILKIFEKLNKFHRTANVYLPEEFVETS